MSLLALRHIKRYCTLNGPRGGWHLSGRWVAAPWELNYVGMEERDEVAFPSAAGWLKDDRTPCLSWVTARQLEVAPGQWCVRLWEARGWTWETRERGSYRRQWLHARRISSSVTDIFETRRSIKSAVWLFALAASRDWQRSGSSLLFYLSP